MRRASLLLGLLLFAAACNSEPDVKIAVVMKKYSVQPAEIRVKKGQRVQLTVSTADVQHGFAVPDLGIKEPVQKGRPAVIVFEARQAGTFPITCSIVCGPGHDEMAGRLVVE